MSPIVEELTRRWAALFGASLRGDDIPPGERLRAEGMMEAAVLLDIASAAELQERMARCYEEISGRSLATEFGDDWAAFFSFPQIPAMAARAPVYPSTPD